MFHDALTSSDEFKKMQLLNYASTFRDPITEVLNLILSEQYAGFFIGTKESNSACSHKSTG